MKFSRYPNGFPNGISLRNVPILTGFGGNVFWVDSGAGSNGYYGTETRPFSTLDYAVGRCTANNGDIILVKAGHAETLEADSAVDIDVAGVSVVGLGEGSDRPTFTFATAVAADFKLAANNASVSNLLFVAGIDALTGPIEISGDDCSLIDCEYQDDDTNNYETTDVVVTTGTPQRMRIDGFKFVHDGGSGGTQNQSVIQLNGADKAVIRNCWLVADSGTGVIEDATTSDQILIENCIIENTEVSPTVAILLTATTTGTIRNTNLRVASGTTYLTATNDMQLFEVFGTGTDATTGEKVGTQLAGDIEAKLDVVDGYHDVPSADAVTNTVMRDVVGNKTDAAATGAVSATESLMAYEKQNVTNTEKIGTISNSGGTASIGAILGDVANVDLATRTAVTNTGGTETLNGLLGDFANDSLVSRMDDIGSSIDSTTTDNIQGKIGTDAEMNDRSLFDQLVGSGPSTFPTAAAAANDISLGAVLRYISDLQVSKIAICSIADTSATLTTGGSPVTLFTVTGDVMVRVWGVVGGTAVTSTGSNGTLQIGTTEDPNAIIGATTMDGSQFDATDVWVDTTPTEDCEAMTSSSGWFIIGGGADIVCTVSTNSSDGGVLTMYCEWRPISSGATVVSAI